MDGADPDVVRARADRGIDLVGRVGRESHDQSVADDLPCTRDRGVVLTDMNSVDARRDRQVGPVIEDQQRPGRLAGAPVALRRGEDPVIVAVP